MLPKCEIISFVTRSGQGAFLGAAFLIALLSSCIVKSCSKGWSLQVGEFCFFLCRDKRALSSFFLLTVLLTPARNLLSRFAFSFSSKIIKFSEDRGLGFSFRFDPSRLWKRLQPFFPCLLRSSWLQVFLHLVLFPVFARSLTLAVHLLYFWRGFFLYCLPGLSPSFDSSVEFWILK